MLSQTSRKIFFYLEPCLSPCPWVPWREVEGGPLGDNQKQLPRIPTLNLMKRPYREAEAARQGLWAEGRLESTEIYGAS